MPSDQNGNGNGRDRFVDRAVQSSMFTVLARGAMIVSGFLGSCLLTVLIWLFVGVSGTVTNIDHRLWDVLGRVMVLESTQKTQGAVQDVQGENIRRLNRSFGVPSAPPPQPSVPPR